MLSIVTVGYYMVYWEVWALYPIHKALGVVALIIILPRVMWRLYKGFPTPVGQPSQHMKQLSHAVHWLLLIGTLLLPISGMLYSGFGGYGIDIFGIGLVEKNIINNEIVALNETVFRIAKTSHSWVAYLLTGALILHIGGALKHHFIDKDATLKRMFGK